MTRRYPIIAVTLGEPAGIGPDLAVLLAQQSVAAIPVYIGDMTALAERARLLALPLQVHAWSGREAAALPAGSVYGIHTPCARPVRAGVLDAANAPAVLNALRRAAAGCLGGEFAAMLTLPVHKGVINDAGVPFTGHTEFLAELCGNPLPVMMLMTEGLRVALVTTHLPLHAVPSAITPPLLRQVLSIVHRDLQRWFAIASPLIMVTGLNPHAGEQGHLGREEVTVIQPVIDELRAGGMRLQGALPADTAFIEKNMQQADAFVAMYHDQGLPVLKYLGFGKAVNITLGLPLLRTSVDHGTALEIAGRGAADAGSARYALAVTLRMLEAAA